MVRKKMEGSEEQRRQAARDARERGHAPSQEAGTTGSSKQRHREDSSDHSERLASIRRGKQAEIGENTPEPRPGYGSDEEVERGRS